VSCELGYGGRPAIDLATVLLADDAKNSLAHFLQRFGNG
jgi:hypothetical protein